MKAYWTIFSARFRTLLQYRAAAVAGAATQLFWGLIRMMIFTAFYASTTAPQPMTVQQTVTYVWLGQAMLALIMFGADPEVQAMIRSGNVVYELARPLRLYNLWFVRSVAGRAAPLLLRMTPIYAVALLFLGLQLPHSPAHAALFALAAISAILLSAAVSTLLTISLLWTISGDGLARILPALIWIGSGLIVPLPLFPDWLQPLIAFLPFRGLGDTPFRIYMGMMDVPHALGAVAHQVAWTLVFVAVGSAVLARGTRRLVVQGG